MALYTPRLNREADPEALRAFLAAHPFATLVSAEGGAVAVTHLPLLLDPTRGPRGTLIGHLARANDHWRSLESSGEALAIFHGPSAYVSATWYAPPTSISTWNYAVVHARCAVRVLHEPEAIRAHVHALTEHFEAPEMLGTPGYDDAQLRAIVGLGPGGDGFRGQVQALPEPLRRRPRPRRRAPRRLGRPRGSVGGGTHAGAGGRARLRRLKRSPAPGAAPRRPRTRRAATGRGSWPRCAART